MIYNIGKDSELIPVISSTNKQLSRKIAKEIYKYLVKEEYKRRVSDEIIENLVGECPLASKPRFR